MLNIKKNTENGKTVFTLEGRLDTVTAPELEQTLKESLDGVGELVFDLKDLEYISSAGLRVLLMAQKAMAGKGDMKVKNPNEIVSEVFEVTGFTEILNIQ